MAQITIVQFSDYVLSQQVCHYCNKYLSVTPVKVYPNRRIKCGRCVIGNDDGDEDNGVDSLFNKIAKISLFKCINKFDGCTELLKTSDVLKHEETCLPKKYTCPLCSEQVFTFLMVLHFKQNHVEAFLEIPSFKVNLKHLKKHFLYKSDDNLFFVNFNNVTRNSADNLRVFSLTVLYLGEKDHVKRIKANFSHFDRYTNTDISSQSISSNPMICQFSLDGIHNINSHLVVTFRIDLEHSIGNILKIEPMKYFEKEHSSTLSNDFSLRKFDRGVSADFVGDKMKLLCIQKRDILPNDDFLKLATDISISNSSTITFKISNKLYTVTLACNDCSLIYPSIFENAPEMIYFIEVDGKYFLNCFMCNTPKKPKKAKILSSKILLDISIFCVWDCGEAYNYEHLYVHERICEKQFLQKCPIETCLYHSNLTELKKHFENSHSSVLFQSFDSNNRWNTIDLCRSKSNIQHILLYWCICVHVQFKWEKPFWKINLSCKIPEVQLKAVITNENDVRCESFTGSGFIRHHNKIRIFLRIINNDKE